MARKRPESGTPRSAPLTGRDARARAAASGRGNRAAASDRAGQSRAGQSRTGLHRSGFALISLALLVLAVLVLAPGVKMLMEQRREIDDLKAQIAYQEQRVDDLSEEKARWSDPSYVRAQVRERLYYVMPGEISYLLIDDREQPGPEAPDTTSRELQTTQVDWLGAFGQSLLIAGLSERSFEELETGAPAPSDAGAARPASSGEADRDEADRR